MLKDENIESNQLLVMPSFIQRICRRIFNIYIALWAQAFGIMDRLVGINYFVRPSVSFCEKKQNGSFDLLNKSLAVKDKAPYSFLLEQPYLEASFLAWIQLRKLIKPFD